LISAKSCLFTRSDTVNSSMMVISPIRADWGNHSELIATVALQACNDSQIAVIQFGHQFGTHIKVVATYYASTRTR
jgi:hypothetical protein